MRYGAVSGPISKGNMNRIDRYIDGYVDRYLRMRITSHNDRIAARMQVCVPNIAGQLPNSSCTAISPHSRIELLPTTHSLLKGVNTTVWSSENWSEFQLWATLVTKLLAQPTLWRHYTVTYRNPWRTDYINTLPSARCA